LKLHLGCGSTVVAGWVNLDKSPGVLLSPRARQLLWRARILSADQANAVFPPGITRADVREGLRYGAETVSFIYSSHMIEHMNRSQALELLRECHRVLEPGGTIRLATPDLAVLIAEYNRGEAPYGATPADSLVEQLGTFRDLPGSTVQRLGRRLLTAPHQWLYDGPSLCVLFQNAGFANPSVREYLESALPDIAELEIRPDSLFVEATR
jgi:predicted SAM-dependent methyltransferase